MFTSKPVEETMNADTVQVEGSAPAGMAPEAPPMSAQATLIGLSTKPRQTYQALQSKPRVLAPLLVVLIFQVVFGLVLAQSGILKNDTLARLEAKNAPPEQIEAVTRVMDGPAKYGFVFAGPIVLVFSLLVSAALIYFIANLMLGARLRYIHYLCIAAYGAVVGILDQLVRLMIALSRGTLQVHLGAGAGLTLLWGLMMTTPAFAQATRDTLGFNGAGADPGVAEPAGPPGERWSLARAVAAALEGSVDARAAHARTLQARGSALSAWSGILPSLTGNLSYNHSIPDQRTSTYVVQDSSGAQTTFLVN